MKAQMLEFTRKLVNETIDPRQKIILAEIYDDETKHRKLLLDM